jgi:hypothetical protein
MIDRATVLEQLEAGIEQLADLEHARWAHWQRYLHDHAERTDDGALVIAADMVERWERQIETPYADLPEEEKESDREQVRRYIPLVADLLAEG